ncbi:MAG TPA: hypothetical protein VFK44_06325, partial [Bacillales bacterium]|nr:hypothetical protein [Bacillales bacterium]
MNLKSIRTMVILVALIAAIVFPFLYSSNRYFMDLGISIMIWSVVAQSWILLGGSGGMWSLGHTAFFGIGAYVTAFFTQWGVPAVLGFPAGFVVAAL